MADDEQLENGAISRHQYQQTNQDRDEEIVQVVYQSDQNGALVGVESTSLLGTGEGGGEMFASGVNNANYEPQTQTAVGEPSAGVGGVQVPAQGASGESSPAMIGSYHEQLSRAGSTLPSVAEEPHGSGQTTSLPGHKTDNPLHLQSDLCSTFAVDSENVAPLTSFAGLTPIGETINLEQVAHQHNDLNQQQPIYSTIKRTNQVNRGQKQQQQLQQAFYEEPNQTIDLYNSTAGRVDELADEQQLGETKNLIDHLDDGFNQQQPNEFDGSNIGGGDDVKSQDLDGNATGINQEIGHILTRHRPGAVEKGSFRNNFRKKLGLSVSTNENDLTAYRQKLLESSNQEASANLISERSSDVAAPTSALDSRHLHASLPSKFKRTHSVSFNVNSSRGNRHSVDIRNLPSYLTHKRASIVDVARGAMSSLMNSLSSNATGGGGSSGSGSAISSQRRESAAQAEDREPIFEEPIAPTLSLGQRVAMVRSVGAEFGTVGWIGQFPDVDDDWIVGVIFDNMIGDCDGAYNGVRYFYARENYAMFVPLSCLTKTDNYIGRPETGTMLSRMSVSLKPGQLISIQRSSIRLQHCFLNAPHQRVGHDVRAVSNRLHCQCHNCGPCAHLTKQGRINALPHFGAHHLPHKKKNSLAHAAVEMLAHHHHHFHEEEEEHEEKDYEFGDNAAHACNFVRYSCCQQAGTKGHEFSRDCEMVRPELLDNLIHAPKAPHRRHTKPGRTARTRRPNQQAAANLCQVAASKPHLGTLEGVQIAATAPIEQVASDQFNTIKALEYGGNQIESLSPIDQALDEGVGGVHEKYNQDDDDEDKSHRSSYLSSRSSDESGGSSSGSLTRSNSASFEGPVREPYNYYQYDTSSFRPTSGVYNTINSQISFLDQQRFVYQRDSAAFMQSTRDSNYSGGGGGGDGSYEDDGSNYSRGSQQQTWADSLGFSRILRCLGCLRQQVRGGGSGRRSSRCRRRPRRKLSFRDRVLEYRRRQSTFVPSTLAKPHEDFATHGIVMPQPTQAVDRNQSAHRGRRRWEHKSERAGEANSDYSSCSRSSCSSSSRSQSPPNYLDATCLNATIPMQTQEQQEQPLDRSQVGTMALDHEQSSKVNYQLKSSGHVVDQSWQDEPYKPQLNYGDFTFGDGYRSYEKHELSRDSALTDLGHSDTCKSNSSSDTLKHLVDQSINERVSLPQPLPEMLDEMISPMSSVEAHRGEQGGDQTSSNSGQYDISSPTASVANTNEDEDNQESARRGLENFTFDNESKSNK